MNAVKDVNKNKGFCRNRLAIAAAWDFAADIPETHAHQGFQRGCTIR